jgi:hypothetical protein
MLRKSLILGSITLLMVMLFALTGCEGPVGPAGPAGTEGRDAEDGQPGADYIPSGASWAGPVVKASDLEAAFKYTNGNIVILQTSVTDVYGEVPAGKILHVLGSTRVLAGQVLTVNGTLDILEKTATLAAGGVGRSGSLKAGESAKIQGKGAVILPYVFKDAVYKDALHYNSPEVQDVADRYPGSAFRLSYDAPELLLSADIAQIFEDENLNELTVQDVSNLTEEAIPPRKSLILRGDANTIESTFELGGFSRLTVAENAALLVRNFATGAAVDLSTKADGIITNNGKIELYNAGSRILVGNTTFINNGEIYSKTIDNLIVTPLIGLEGNGVIKLVPEGVGGTIDYLSLPKPALRQHLVIDPRTTSDVSLALINQGIPLNGVDYKKTITLANERAVIVLLAGPAGIGATIVNKGRITTATTNPLVLETLFGEMGNKGKITGSGNLVDLSKDFEIPAGVELTLSGGSTDFGSDVDGPWDVIIGGSLELSGAIALLPEKDVIVSGHLALGTGSLVAQGNVTITGTLDVGSGNGLEVQDGILAIPSRGVSGTTGLIKAVFGKITVDGVPGYGIPAGSGVLGADLESAVDNTLQAADALKNTIALDPSSSNNSSQATFQAVGTADLTGNAPTKVVYKPEVTIPTPGTPEVLIGLPDGVGVYTNGFDERGHYLAGSVGSANVNPNTFAAGVKTENLVNVFAVSDSGYTGSSSSGYVVEFNSVRFTNKNLVGPVVPSFYVGIKSNR